jgi:methyl-accepting chemotaxis protein
VGQVRRGTQEVGRSGEAMHAIMEQINELTLQVSQIATAAEEQTATTSEISGSIMQITVASSQSSSGARLSADEAHNLNKLAESLSETLATLSIDQPASLCLRKAKSAHMIFTGKIKSHLDGKLRLDPGALPTHQTCAVGKWFQDQGRQTCGHLSAFGQIDAPHAKVHELGKLAVASYNAGDRQAAADHCKEMVSQSRGLINLLERLEKDCG